MFGGGGGGGGGLILREAQLSYSVQVFKLYRDSTVKPPNRGHFGDGPFVPCREVVLFSEVLF